MTRRSPRSSSASARRSDAVRMEVKRFGYFPQEFVWHGRRYNVHAVERCWTVSRRLFWDVERHCFRVRCAEGMFELYQDAKRNTWHVSRFERA
jgi:hypothetical protein